MAKINAFTNEEEAAVKLDEVVPFRLESKLIERGAKFEKSGFMANPRYRRRKSGNRTKSSICSCSWRSSLEELKTSIVKNTKETGYSHGLEEIPPFFILKF